MSLILELPDEVVRAMRLPPPERKRRAEIELACALYGQGVLACGKAAQLAGMSRFRFGQELAARNIPRHYTEENLQQDLSDDGG
jgi:predicted HTH domain antitoxin